MLPALITLIQGVMTVAPAVEAAVRLRRARELGEVARDIEAERMALQQTWQAYGFQTRQRVLTFSVFVVTIALLAVGYTVALTGDLPVLAALNAVAGAALVVFLNRFDAIYGARLKLTERTFRELDEALIAAGDPSRAGLVPRTGGLSQDIMMMVFQATAFWGFVAAMVYAVIEAS